MIRFEIPGLKLESLANAREHWRRKAARAKTQRRVACCLMQSHMAGDGIDPNQLPMQITITRVGKRKLDSDNLAISAKHCRDGIADALGIDDGDESAVQWHYQQQIGKEYGVIVQIEKAKPEAQ